MNPFRHMATVGHNTKVIVYNRRLTELEGTVKQWSEGDMEHNGLYWRWARSSTPPGYIWRLWRSASTPMERFPLNGNIHCWCPPCSWMLRPHEIYIEHTYRIPTMPMCTQLRDWIWDAERHSRLVENGLQTQAGTGSFASSPSHLISLVPLRPRASRSKLSSSQGVPNVQPSNTATNA